jgi:glycosyltransferase involved in cell wall biosynthesis
MENQLSVVITTRNRHQLLKRAVASVKNEGTNAEIIIVDDASGDETNQYCSSEEGIRYIRLSKNEGTAAARNAGISASSNAFISFLDDDDWRLPGTFSSQLSVLRQNPSCGLVYGKVL